MNYWNTVTENYNQTIDAYKKQQNIAEPIFMESVLDNSSHASAEIEYYTDPSLYEEYSFENASLFDKGRDLGSGLIN